MYPLLRFFRSGRKGTTFFAYVQEKSAVCGKTCTFFSLVCYARLLSVGRLVLLRNVYLHAVGIKLPQAINAVRQYTAVRQ